MAGRKTEGLWSDLHSVWCVAHFSSLQVFRFTSVRLRSPRRFRHGIWAIPAVRSGSRQYQRCYPFSKISLFVPLMRPSGHKDIIRNGQTRKVGVKTEDIGADNRAKVRGERINWGDFYFFCKNITLFSNTYRHFAPVLWPWGFFLCTKIYWF